ncbi:hypothetical protein NJC38_02535 [Pseudomonas sp. 21LCFQ010]|uniref:hypothetical protein n=1 Tax=Pseudomonas sp. 21LCFQ010 TaxID=2957506 RepID=UPI00209745FB|nr:hypothetical protein [Pseudomonas sp. 21LCFQ010]MCO8161027.1 hypothetical protein [Pseudomonas sp. 21LCFQ010]
MANEDECLAAGIDPTKVDKHRRALEKVMKAMAADNIMLFGGGDGSSLRPRRGDSDTQLLILAHVRSVNIDGGAGACKPGYDGLLRGEA